MEGKDDGAVAVEEPSGTESSNLLQTFWGLSSLDQEERLGAARDLLLTLTTQQEATPEGMCQELEYTVKRLIRGLASHRKGARQGYFIALTEVLSRFPSVGLHQVLELVSCHLKASGSAKAVEERGANFGQVFAMLAIIQSGRLSEPEHIMSVLKCLIDCSQKKSYLKEFCAVAVCHLVDVCPAEVLKKTAVPSLPGLTGGWEGCTPETLLLMLHLSQKHTKEKWFKELLSTHWGGHRHLVHRKTFGRMTSALLESSWSHPRLHSVWPLVVNAVRDSGHFGTFWKVVVDDGLFLSSHERKFMGFKLLETLLPTLTASEVPLVFSPNLLHCLVNHTSSADNYLHSAAKHLLSEVSSMGDHGAGPSIPVAIFLHLQLRTGSKFDQLSGTKTTEGMLRKLDTGGLEQLVERLEAVFHQPEPAISDSESGGDAPSDATSVQLWALDQILALVRSHSVSHTDSWLLQIAEFLIRHAHFQKSGDNQLVRVVREACTAKLTSVLVELSSAVSQDQEEGGVEEGRRRFGRPGVMKDGQFFLTAVLMTADDLMKRGDWQLVDPFSEEDSESWETVMDFVRTRKDDQITEMRAFVLLLSAVGVHLLSVTERQSNRELIQDALVCHEELLASQTKTPHRTSRKGGVAGKWVEVLMDVLLSLLSRPSLLWRVVVEQVFRMEADSVTLEALKMLLKVLEFDSTEDVMKREGEEEEEEEEEEGEEEEEEGEREEEEGGAVSSAESESGEEEEGGGAEVDPMFRMEVKKALGAAALDSDQHSSSEESMDDEAMMAVDEALAAVFRSKFAARHQRKQKKEDEKSVMHFRIRVLGIIDIFLRKHSTCPLVLELVVPLYQLIHCTQGKSIPLNERATAIFQKKLCQPKGLPKLGVDGDHVHSLLHQMVGYLYKASPQTAVTLTQGCMFLLRVLRGCASPPAISPLTTRSGRKRKARTDEQPPPSEQVGLLDGPKVTAWFSDALHDFMSRRTSSVPHIFFTTYIERYPALAWHLVGRMADELSSCTNQFRKVQAYEMLVQLLAQPAEQEVASALLSHAAPTILSHGLEALPTASQKPVKHARPVYRLLTAVVCALRKLQLSSLVDQDAITRTLDKVTSDPSLTVEVRAESEKLQKAVMDPDTAMAPPRKRKRMRQRNMERNKQ